MSVLPPVYGGESHPELRCELLLAYSEPLANRLYQPPDILILRHRSISNDIEGAIATRVFYINWLEWSITLKFS